MGSNLPTKLFYVTLNLNYVSYFYFFDCQENRFLIDVNQIKVVFMVMVQSYESSIITASTVITNKGSPK